MAVREHVENAGSRADGRLGCRTVALACAWTLAIVYVVLAQLPAAAVTLPGQDALRGPIRAGATQGWAFFTKSPREAALTAFSHNGGTSWASAMLGPHSEPRNAFGLGRASRAQGVEMGLLAGALHQENWVDCQDAPLDPCLQQIPPNAVARVDNPMPAPTLCGQIALKRQEPTPWAWATSEAEAMPVAVARLEVSCR